MKSGIFPFYLHQIHFFKDFSCEDASPWHCEKRAHQPSRNWHIRTRLGGWLFGALWLVVLAKRLLCGVLCTPNPSKIPAAKVAEFALRKTVWDARQKRNQATRLGEYFNPADPSFPQRKSGSDTSVVASLSEQVKIKEMQNYGFCDTSIYPPIENVPPRFAISEYDE